MNPPIATAQSAMFRFQSIMRAACVVVRCSMCPTRTPLVGYPNCAYHDVCAVIAGVARSMCECRRSRGREDQVESLSRATGVGGDSRRGRCCLLDGGSGQEPIHFPGTDAQLINGDFRHKLSHGQRPACASCFAVLFLSALPYSSLYPSHARRSAHFHRLCRRQPTSRTAISGHARVTVHPSTIQR